MNVTLIIVLIVLACTMVRGYKKGLVQEVITFLAIIAGVIALALVAAAIDSFLSNHLSNMLIAIILFVVVLIITNIAKFILSSITFLSKMPVVSKVNKLAGMILGLAQGVIIIWIAFILLALFQSNGINHIVMQQVDSNPLLSFIYQNNYIAKLIIGWTFL